MTTIKALIKRHPVLAFYALVFAISWSGILLVVGLGPGWIPATKEQAEMLFLFVLLALFAGPSVAGMVLTGLVYGRAGFRDLLARMTRWRVGARWYAVALLTVPLLVTGMLLAFSLVSPEFLPRILTTGDKATLLLFGVGGLDGLRRAHAVEAAPWRPRYGARRGRAVGSVALPYSLLGERHIFRSALPGGLPSRGALLRWVTSGLQGAHGVGLRAYC